MAAAADLRPYCKLRFILFLGLYALSFQSSQTHKEHRTIQILLINQLWFDEPYQHFAKHQSVEVLKLGSKVQLHHCIILPLCIFFMWLLNKDATELYIGSIHLGSEKTCSSSYVTGWYTVATRTRSPVIAQLYEYILCMVVVHFSQWLFLSNLWEADPFSTIH